MAFDVQAAKQAGYSDQEIQSYMATKQPAAQAPADKNKMLYDLLPLIGGIGGSFIPGLGTIVGGALGSGAGALLKQGLEQQPIDLGEVAKEAALGGAGGVIGKGAGWLGGKVLGAGADALAQGGEDLGVKALRLNKPQLANFLTRHGEDAGEFLSKEGAIGKTAEDLATQHIEPLQDQFNAIAKTSGVKVDPNTFTSNILDQYKKLLDAGGSENAGIADNLLKEADYVMQNNLQGAGHDVSAYDTLRRTFANKVNWANPGKAAEDYAMSDALRKTVIDTADQSGLTSPDGMGLKDIGIKLSKYRDLEKAATAQAQLGRGSLPMGITKWLATNAGMVTGGPVGGAVGLAANNLINNPTAMRFIARAAVKGGQTLDQGLPETISGVLAGRTAAQGAPRIPEAIGGAQSAFDPSQMPQGPADMSPASAQNPQDQNLRQVLAALMFKKAKSISDLKDAYDMYSPTSSKPLNAAQQTLQANAQSGLRALGVVENTLKTDPNATWTSKIPVVSGRSPYAAASREVADVLTRLRTGAALNKEEQDFYEKQLPQAFDTPQVIQYKLSLFRNLFNKFATGQTPDTSTIPNPTSYPSLTR